MNQPNTLVLSRFNPALAIKQSVAAILIAATLMTSSCTIFNSILSHETPSVVQNQTAGVLYATRLAVTLPPWGSSADLVALNAFVTLVHEGALKLVDDLQKGVAALPTSDQIRAFLAGYAAQFGNPVWMQNMIGNLVTTYQKFYNVISKDTPTAVAYLTAFANGTV
jgi:hypothetical protein